MSRKTGFFAPMLLLLACAASAPAQGRSGNCTVQVFVADAAGARIPGAVVQFTPASRVTDKEGQATVSLAGNSKVSVRAQGFEAKEVPLKAPLPARVSLALSTDSGPESSAPVSDQPSVPDQLSILGTTTETLTPAQLAALPHTALTVENGHTHKSETYSGVPLIDLLAKAGAPIGADVKGKALSMYVVATGSDSYKAVLALAEAEPDFHPGVILVADQLDGKPLDAKEGPFKLVVGEDQRPARSVHNLVKIELKQAE